MVKKNQTKLTSAIVKAIPPVPEQISMTVDSGVGSASSMMDW